MKNTAETRGIKIDREVLSFLNKACEKAGSIRKLANICGFTPSNISKWNGKVGTQKVDNIEWSCWEPLWQYLTKEEIISPEDVRWMPPSVLREIMIKQRDVKIVNNGNNSGVIGINHDSTICAGEIEAFRSALLQGIIDLEIDDAAKVIIMRFVRDFRQK